MANSDQARQNERERWEKAAPELKPRIEDYLLSKGLSLNKNFKCLNPDHDDNSPSMGYDKKNYQVHCFSCQAKYDIFDLVGMDYGLSDTASKLRKVAEMYGYNLETGEAAKVYQKKPENEQRKPEKAPEKEYTQFFALAHKNLNQTNYIQERGLSAGVAERFNLGYAPEYITKDHNGETVKWRALIIPTSNHTYQVRNTDPNAHHKDRYRKKGESRLFNARALFEAKSPIYVVEGEIDALSIIEVGGEAVGLGSYDNVHLFLKAVEAYKPTQPIAIAFDNETDPDKAAKVDKAAQELENGLKKLGVKYYRRSPQGEYKDANEALQKDREAFSEAVASVANIEAEEAELKAELAKKTNEENKEKYLRETQVRLQLQSFLHGISESINTPCTSTGFEKLDAALDGGLYEGLITIGAISSLGKTSLVLQIGDQIASQGEDVLIFSLEMARAELMAKSISRLTLLQVTRDENGKRIRNPDTRQAKTARGITDGKRHANYSTKENEIIKAAMSRYYEYADHIYIREGVGDIGVKEVRTAIDEHIRYTGRRPIVIVDYLQIMAPYSDRMSDKQNTDKAILELKRISRDYKLSVIAISSFNRMSYNNAVSMEAFKESGAIEYSSDVLIGLNLEGAGKQGFDPTAAKKKDPREVELTILKNRSGRVGDKISFKYYPMFNYFEEV